MKLLLTSLIIAALTVYSNATVAPLSVKGNQVLIDGKSGVLRGNSLFWSNNDWEGAKFYNADVVNWLKSDWKSDIVRAAMGVEESGGYLTDATSNKNRVITVVDAAIKADMYVIIDWHSHYAHQHKSEAIAFFEEMATKYGENNNVIYEIFNEPKDDVNWSNDVKPYAIEVIKAIRAIDPDNLIIVGTTAWSQDVDVAANDPITGYENIAYTLHFYAASHGEALRSKATTALGKNIALFVTEWGTVNADGSGAVATTETNNWISFLEKNGISYVNWSINDKSEGASALKPGSSTKGGWSSSDLTESGTFVRDLLRSKAT